MEEKTIVAYAAPNSVQGSESTPTSAPKTTTVPGIGLNEATPNLVSLGTATVVEPEVDESLSEVTLSADRTSVFRKAYYMVRHVCHVLFSREWREYYKEEKRLAKERETRRANGVVYRTPTSASYLLPPDLSMEEFEAWFAKEGRK